MRGGQGGNPGVGVLAQLMLSEEGVGSGMLFSLLSRSRVASPRLCSRGLLAPAAPGRVCLSGPRLPAERAAMARASHKGGEANPRERRRPASGGHTPATRSSRHQPSCFKGANASRAFFTLGSGRLPSPTNPLLRALMKGRQWRPPLEEAARRGTFFRFWVPFIKHPPRASTIN